MKKILIPENVNQYKANLHCHTVLSDGKQTPEYVKELYKAHGYSVVAYTDHDVFLSHQDLKDDDFLPLNGYEAEVNEPMPEGTPWTHQRTCHMCFIQKDPNNMKPVCSNRNRYFYGNAVNYVKDMDWEGVEDYTREYSGPGICDMMKRGREAGFFVTYNHPRGSRESYPYYTRYEGMHALEVVNYAIYRAGYDVGVQDVYDDLLQQGKRIAVTASDDNHSDEKSCGAWTQIIAEKLDYETIMDALFANNYYASMGPKIFSLYVEDGYAHIKTSDAKRITMLSDVGGHKYVVGSKEAPVNEATLEIMEGLQYIRFTIADFEGNLAYTRAYFMDELA